MGLHYYSNGVTAFYNDMTCSFQRTSLYCSAPSHWRLSDGAAAEPRLFQVPPERRSSVVSVRASVSGSSIRQMMADQLQTPFTADVLPGRTRSSVRLTSHKPDTAGTSPPDVRKKRSKRPRCSRERGRLPDAEECRGDQQPPRKAARRQWSGKRSKRAIAKNARRSVSGRFSSAAAAAEESSLTSSTSELSQAAEAPAEEPAEVPEPLTAERVSTFVEVELESPEMSPASDHTDRSALTNKHTSKFAEVKLPGPETSSVSKPTDIEAQTSQVAVDISDLTDTAEAEQFVDKASPEVGSVPRQRSPFASITPWGGTEHFRPWKPSFVPDWEMLQRLKQEAGQTAEADVQKT